MQIFTTLHTNGLGYWSNKAKAVDITQLRLQYCNPEKDFGELCVHFTQASWDTATDGLIYTDKLFRTELRASCKLLGLRKQKLQTLTTASRVCRTRSMLAWTLGLSF